jgi:alpha-galactosidase
VIGNSRLGDEGFELHLQSLAGSLPIFLGDPRKMDAGARALSRRYSLFFDRMQRLHDVFSFRQDLEGFGEPMLGNWDGFQRINTDTRSGGMVGVFRHGAKEDRRKVTLGWLDPAARYRVRTMDGKLVASGMGSSLAKQGFDVHLPREYDGKLFEVGKA